MQNAYVKLDKVSKIYKMGEVKIKAVDEIGFEISKGEFVVIVGPSGAGKTTVLNILGGMDTATKGTVLVDGKNITDYNSRQLTAYRRDDIGFVFQFYNLIPVLNVVENITLPLRLDGQRINKEHLDELLELLDLSDRRKHLPKQLSGGQQQRVSIGRALIHAPALLLADEPTGNLDEKNSQEIMELIKYSNRRYKQTTLIVTHDESIALQTGRIIRMEDGRIVSDEKI